MVKVGDIVKYTGELSGEPPCSDCIVEHIEGPNEMFNQPMAIVSGVDCWVAVAELEGE